MSGTDVLTKGFTEIDALVVVTMVVFLVVVVDSFVVVRKLNVVVLSL